MVYLNLRSWVTTEINMCKVGDTPEKSQDFCLVLEEIRWLGSVEQAGAPARI